ncbi:MAG: dephospho-CoA kinase [Flavobacteriia bacterium]|nr:dephospho-CoA kinase [Flavobacteriia bacterium]
MSDTIQVGLTGGIGSGKSTVAKIFEAFHIPCYYADDRAKWLMENDDQLVQELSEAFGTELYTDGKLNREWLANRIFSNPDERNTVNSLVHPAVGRDFAKWTKAQNAPYVLKEAAILFETGGYKASDFNILVTAPEEIRVKRVTQRDGATPEQVRSRMQAQWPDEKKAALADFIILNDENEPLIPQVKQIHEAILLKSDTRD